MKTVKHILFAVLFAASSAAWAESEPNGGTDDAGMSAYTVSATLRGEVIEHGGGCRKSSPPGMCCHMDNRTGVVHCH